MTRKSQAEQQRPRIDITDAARMRAMAHPARLAILDRLLYDGPATATECARVVGLSPSATSYHLRALARVGLIEEAPDRGDARERLWRPTDVSVYVEAGQNAAPDALAAERELVEAWLAQNDARYRRWLARSQSEPAEWYEAAGGYSAVLIATAGELAQLRDAVDKLLEPLRKSHRTDPPAGARTISSFVLLFPADDPVQGHIS
ncbi:MAG: winged helix-turn-helix transcriptional regulator [Micromonosporaceae bacterium]|nr:winged helix-turn-helix transcriptional regulator [Micromonosporaceae bacterium]